MGEPDSPLHSQAEKAVEDADKKALPAYRELKKFVEKHGVESKHTRNAAKRVINMLGPLVDFHHRDNLDTWEERKAENPRLATASVAFSKAAAAAQTHAFDIVNRTQHVQSIEWTDRLKQAIEQLDWAKEHLEAALIPMPARDPALEARDLFLYNYVMIRGRSEREVRDEANKMPGWPRLGSRSHTWKVIDAYIRRHGLPPRPPRREGRPLKQSPPGNVNRDPVDNG
jgi:hypothetical protein